MLKFTPFSSAVDASFWQTLASKKLDLFKLDQEAVPIHGYYTPLVQTALNQQGEKILLPSHLSVPADGLEQVDKQGSIAGTLINTNTIEEFRTIDKNQLFQQVTNKITNLISSGEALKNPNDLNAFLLVTFADLKKYKFYYWFAFPAIIPQQESWQLINQHDFAPQETESLHEAYQLWDQSDYYFLIKKDLKEIQLSSLSTYQPETDVLFGFVDPSAVKGAPGWPLRNFLYLLYKQWGLEKVKVVCYRPNDSYQVELHLPQSYEPIKSVGWERNIQGKLGPRMADLGPLMDPARLADTAIDLNLKLMRWRLLPELDLDAIKQKKCLLLGAGTLGCYVARFLMGWGVRHVTFVDNGKVSFSNPVRQPLYEFQDTLNGGLPKAEAAANHLKLIQPTIVSEGHCLSIPMPGHDHSTLEALEKDLTRLEGLVENHDVIFLLTDSRESRWLPTLLGKRHNKCVINSALGFDSYLVMRHGTFINKMGCYFCNDIVAPIDSLTDRTLDQQCTVTRPGLAAVAGALAVELMVSLIQHPKGIHAEADTKASTPSSILGLLPHQIRGFLGQFENMLIIGQAYDKCTACSEKVLAEYDKDPLNFVKSVLKDPMVLEEITGLMALKAESDALLLNDDWAEEEDDF